MASFKDFMRARQEGGVQAEQRSWDMREAQRPSEYVCATSQPCRCGDVSEVAVSRRRARRCAVDLDHSALVSVICPTTAARSELHQVLYGSFAAQNYEPKELLVLDTGGSAPSPFFARLQDARVTYIHEPSLVVGPNGSECVGIKRNRLCAMAKGAAIACFDDDNIYGPEYLTVMLQHLRRSGSALITMGAYYTAELSPTGVLVGGWLNSNRGAVSHDSFLQIRGTVVGRAKKRWDKRGETFLFPKSVFDKGGARFTEHKSIGEEEAFYRGDDHHPIVDDQGIFVHVDHAKNTGAPLTHVENEKDLPARLDALVREYEPCYRRFAEALRNGTAEKEIRYEKFVDGWIQKPRQNLENADP